MNACWTSGWKRLEVIGTIEEAFEEYWAKLDNLVDSEKTADATNDFYIKRVTSAMKPSGQQTEG